MRASMHTCMHMCVWFFFTRVLDGEVRISVKDGLCLVTFLVDKEANDSENLNEWIQTHMASLFDFNFSLRFKNINSIFLPLLFFSVVST